MRDQVRVILDRNALQSRADLCISGRGDQLEPGQRLRDVRDTLESEVPCHMRYSEDGPITREQLQVTDVLLIPTRDTDAAFTEEELDIIYEFVSDGGGLVLMTNHPPFTEHDRRLARRFGVEIEETAFRRERRGERITLSGKSLRGDHPIISGGETDRSVSVESIVINNGASLKADPSWTVASYPEGLRDATRQGLKSAGRVFAVAVPTLAGERDGRVVVTGDSGFIGSDDTRSPGPGLFNRGRNSAFLINTLRWVGRR